jgi:hypothetical protein
VLIDGLYYLDRILTVIFFLETTLKLFAMGFVAYFGNAWYARGSFLTSPLPPGVKFIT